MDMRRIAGAAALVAAFAAPACSSGVEESVSATEQETITGLHSGGGRYPALAPAA
jgi:hypothetical protein